MADNSKRAKKTYTMNQSISHIKQKASSRTVSRNHSTSNKISLNCQGRKKIPVKLCRSTEIAQGNP